MTGTIKRTFLNGGMIQPDGDTGPLVPFRWCDSELQPNDCGYDSRVNFYIEILAGRERAIAVKLAK